MTKPLTNMPDSGLHRLWAELDGDSPLGSLRLATLGWVPRKRERVLGPTPRHAFCLLARGQGSFLHHADTVPRSIQGPGVFFTSPGMRHDYGPVRTGQRWEEYYWIVEGSRVDEWIRCAWWPASAGFWPVPQKMANDLTALFNAGVQALEQRNRTAIDAHKLALERHLQSLALPFAPAPALDPSPLTSVLEAWRRDPCRPWSLPEAARTAGVSYTRFRLRFLEEHGTSPYDYLLRLRIELAARWLRSTSEPVKSIAARCGFQSVETFIRAFSRLHRTSPQKWRRQLIRENRP